MALLSHPFFGRPRWTAFVSTPTPVLPWWNTFHRWRRRPRSGRLRRSVMVTMKEGLLYGNGHGLLLIIWTWTIIWKWTIIILYGLLHLYFYYIFIYVLWVYYCMDYYNGTHNMNYNIINWIIMVYYIYIYIYIYIFIISSYILIMDIYGLLLHGNIYIYIWNT